MTVQVQAQMRTIAGDVALVTGGSRGIGAAIALRLAEEGADVAFTYRDSAERAQAVVKEIEALGRRAVALRADSASPAEVRAAVGAVAERFGRLDVLVNCAGVGAVGPLAEVTDELMDQVLDVNVRGVLTACRAALPHLADGGRIVTIGSCMNERVPFAGAVLYATSKSALTGLTRALAREVGDRGITVNLVNPGPTDTEMNPADGDGADFQRSLTALGRYAAPAEIAAVVAHLVGPGARYVTGATVAVDGGF
ncbi:SDR family NAD(P)-dependent oxidoreductase [Kitasatospora sp. NPDC048365]|uniref:SDR family NAD(P)-dependent oxidoreductase n=1 Tax=Kitasatospora sp. NPDC048365 TaxID=3364050 RepID=UPI003723751B